MEGVQFFRLICWVRVKFKSEVVQETATYTVCGGILPCCLNLQQLHHDMFGLGDLSVVHANEELTGIDLS